jgi:hypothetical protein
VELVGLLGYYTSRGGRLPGRYRKVGFWVTRFVLALIAGALAVAYEIDKPILAFNIGAATPLIVTFMTKGLRQAPPAVAPPMPPPDRIDREPAPQPTRKGSMLGQRVKRLAATRTKHAPVGVTSSASIPASPTS